MIITLSPAKLMNFGTPALMQELTVAPFQEKAEDLNTLLMRLDMDAIKRLMKINPTQAIEVFQYIHGFDDERTPRKQAVFAYNGIAFSGLGAGSMTASDLHYAQSRLLIQSGLYGVLRPLDAIKPYRLEMQAKLRNSSGENLYAYWREATTQYLSKALGENGNVWLNLASDEYTKAIDVKTISKHSQIITPVFKQQTDSGYRQVVVHTKKARGLLARFVLVNRIEDTESVKAFDYEGYTFSPRLSNGNEYVFVR
ncbi:cytoplasmic iron level regulating protein YaaA (DUF328/UPF0246 family) [Dysgonomonas sp. PH5-45]|uniref:YaaA family protein n=1 Tax=unclassified Dysgonomonas TaxID=2630389 RepID=UPI002473BBA6|nr:MULTISPECIES: YaaA family protein [unclassified Dysgonomonas]MDH6354316.1 cytoplasmic iron level regulating protein YaaA (DUF328/UPF0246 family) [Dysgonomonas sp. PH5-45]MDH6387216.1 cytoplasmic iron level regulating protein YaaA (DUF328/UPF0246 family) [Dysgonomonas sp. PH5-37]